MTTSLPFPPSALEQHLIALGKTGAGKSSTMRLMVEHLLDREQPVCMIDPKGDWYGIKSSADGRSDGFPVVIFGGEHADVPITEHSGAAVAEIVASGNRPSLIDLGGWQIGERTRFFVRFAGAFFKHARGLRHLVIDEVHNFAPQGRVLDPDSGKMLHWANRLASEGRGRGITLLAASQRPQKVHKDFVTSCETLVALKVIHKRDRDAIKDWIDGCADPDAGKRVIAELAALKKGEAFVWSPEIEFGPERVQFPMFRTYDSFKPSAHAVELAGWAAVDLEGVRARLSEAVAAAEANDPAFLKKRVAELEQMLCGRTIAVEESAELQALRAENEQLQKQLAWSVEYSKVLALGIETRDKVLAFAKECAQTLIDASLLPLEPIAHPPMDGAELPAPPVRTAARRSSMLKTPVSRMEKPRAGSSQNGSNGSISKGARVVLTAIAQHPDGCDPEQITVLTGYKRSSRDTYLQKLRSCGYVSAGWPATATAEGLAVLGADFEPLPTGADLRDYWLARLPAGEAKVLQVLIQFYPSWTTKAEIDEATGYKRSSRDTYLQKLRARKLIDVATGQARASEVLF